MTNQATHAVLYLSGRGLKEFWSWWSTELVASIPPTIKQLFPRRVTFLDIAQDSIKVTRIEQRGPIRHRQNLLQLEEALTGKQLSDRVLKKIQKSTSKAKSLVIRFDPSFVLIRNLTLPLAAEANLKQAVGLQLDRLFPLPTAQVVHDAEVSKRNRQSRTIEAEVAILERSHFEMVQDLCDRLDRLPKQIGIYRHDTDFMNTGKLEDLTQFNFEEETKPAISEEQRLVALIAVLAVMLTYVANIVSTQQYYGRVRHLTELLTSFETNTDQIEPLRKDLDLYRQAYNKLKLKSAHPPVTRLLAELTAAMPETSYLTNFTYNQDQIEISGKSQSPETIKAALRKSKYFEEVDIQSISQVPAQLNEFTGRIDLAGGQSSE